ncbi:MAG: molybdopterin cofactor-binding domain-containing protein [Mizugakiibacter sp.]|uniref:xanthine dehydrogenase family protein molybdopterin-binding subunit n=1 Tax=Mizugakiibacter sp. TaxID=1972610 RepID=UPI0031CA0581|nr:molybdopterin-dependent oxidoreductase [Xanthomonadaceae bacterium]
MSATLRLSRRRFLQVLAGAAGALVVGVRADAAGDDGAPLELLGDDYSQVGPFVRIEPDGRVIIGARAPDMGQGTRTALPRIIAEELDADWARVTVLGMPLGVEDDGGKPRFVYGDQSAGGSTSIPQAWQDLRQAGAAARWLLVQAAARRWNVPAASLRTEANTVIAADGRRAGYGELAADAARIDLPRQPLPLKAPAQYRLVGKPAWNVDARDIVTGALPFAIDQTFAEALVAVIARCPYLDGSLAEVDDAEALKVKGVVKVLPLPGPDPALAVGVQPLAPGVAVLATDTWAALQGRDRLKLVWKPGMRASESTAALEQQALDKLAGEPTQRARDDGDFAKLFKLGRKIQADYFVPYVAHATMEPMNCLALVEADHATVIAPTQTPERAFEVVQRLTGLAASQIEIRFPRIGGGFGRRLEDDYVAEAVLLAKAVGKPVKLMWTREDDFTHDVYRPCGVHRMSAATDRRRRIIAWRHQLASASKRNGRGGAGQQWTSEIYPDDLPAGLVANLQYDWYALDSGVTRGNWRAPAHVSNAFATQSFLDEIAVALKIDPLKLRLELLGAPRPLPYRSHGGPVLDTGRLANVLRLAAARIGWDQRRTNGHGLGIACHFTFGGYAAHAFEVSVENERLLIHRAVCAVDVGRAINPLGLEAQMMGGTIDGLSTALNLAITVKDGQVQQKNFPDYPLARMADMPREVEVHIVESEADPSGAGEIGIPSVAPALANAVYAATTVRVRRLPLMAELKRLL